MKKKVSLLFSKLLNSTIEFQYKVFFQNKKRNYLVLTQVINAIIGVVSGKLIAQYILPEQFGIYNLQFAAYTFFFSLLVGPTIVFIKASYQNLIIEFGTKPFFVILSGFAIVLCLCLITFFQIYNQNIKLDNYFYVLILLLVPFNIMDSLASDQFNVIDNIDLYSSSSILKAVVGFCFLSTSFFIISKCFTGYFTLWGMQLIVSLVGLIYFLLKFKRFKKTKVISYKVLIKKHFQFTGPLMFLALWSWINNYFDRYAIERYMTLKDVGIYNASYGLGSKFFLLISPIFMVLLTPKIYNDIDIKSKKNIIKKFTKNYFFLGIIILFFVFFLKNFIGNVFLSKAYQEGFYIIFWLALVYFIMTITYQFETIFYAQHNTKVILKSNIISAILNILLNILLIPDLGLIGAVIAMILSTGIRFVFVYNKFVKL